MKPILGTGLLIFFLANWSNCLLVEGIPEEDPNIFPNFTLATPGSSVTISCHGAAPVIWTPFHGFEGYDRMTIQNDTNSGPHPYTSRLTLTEVTFTDVGNYECSYADDTNSAPVFASFSYIFVQDPENLLVPHSPHSYELPSIGLDYTFKTCRPTSPKVHVTLTHEHHLIDPNTDPSVTFDVKKGFTITQVVTTSSGAYTCTAKLGRITQSFDVVLLPKADSTNKLPKPTINATLANSISIGSTFILDCFMETALSTYFDLNWTSPRDVINSGRAKIEITNVSPSGRKRFRARLTVVKAEKSDGGRDYVCNVKGQGNAEANARYRMRVFGRGEEYLHANASDDGNITVNASGDAQWVIDVHGFPMPSDYYWKDPKKIELTNKGRFSMDFLFNQVILTIRDVTMVDGGAYEFTVVQNSRDELTLSLFLTVRDSPKVMIWRSTPTMYLSVNQSHHFRCIAEGYPYPTIEWYFQKCKPEILDQGFGECDEFEQLMSAGQEMANVHENAPRRTFRSVELNITEFGNLKCVANNSVGNGSDEMSIMIVPIDFLDQRKSGFDIIGTTEPIETDDVVYNCAVSIVNSTNNGKWFYSREGNSLKMPAEKLEGVSVIDTSSIWSYQKKLMIKNIQMSHSGEYSCEVEHSNGDESVMEDNIVLQVQALKMPIINDTNLNGTTVYKYPGDKLDTLYCKASGVPHPNISWFKDDLPPDKWPSQNQISLTDDGELTLGYLKAEHAGTYTCRAKNKLGTDEKSITVNVEEPRPVVGILIGVASLVVIAVLGVILSYYIRRERKMKMWLKSLQLDEFENGDVEKINPEEGVDAQVNLLPYDKKYEFPRDRLTLGVRLGSGAFGIVLKGEAKGIKDGEASTTVAVKMVKPNSDENHFKALMSEVKIMIHLEQHVNVVNLLGACTKQLVKKRELLVIVEFCRYGSLLSYVHRHRRDFIDQLDRVRDVVDPNISYPLDSHCQSPHPSASANTGRSSVNGYRTMDQMNVEPNPEDFRRIHNGNNRPDEYLASSHAQSTCTGMSFVSNSPMSDGQRASSTSSGWNGNYHGVYNYRDVKPMTTTDLLCWSFQIARGMEYLATRKILHGDLAARNVLLADDNVVKICDFGLSREMCEEKYKKKSEGVPLPVKWMALEAIYFQLFSTQSDVWSFGVVMWELFTLGKTPYPGMEVDASFYKMLNDGYRMEKPANAPSSIYDMMESCWDTQPSGRPTFTALAELIGNLIEDGVRQHYIDLNAPYTLMNERRRMEGREDYLAKMSGPDYNYTSKRGTPDRTYANISPPQLEAEMPNCMVSPNTLGIPHPTYGQFNEDYQNLDAILHENDGSPSSLQRLANNEGYYYMNKDNTTDSPGPTNIFSPRPLQTNLDQFDFAADDPGTSQTAIKRDTSPPHEIKGVSNTNYLPNNIFSSTIPTRELQDVLEEASNHISDLPLDDGRDHRTRQKNDSGFQSIDSNFESSNKGSSPPLNSHNETNNLLKPNNNHHTKYNNKSQNALSSLQNVPIPT